MILKTAALICAYNEEKHIKKVVEDSSKYVDRVIVVNDGSQDDTLRELRKSRVPLTVITHTINMGKGEALKTGFRYCVNKGYENVVMLDGDGQHKSEEIPRFVKELNNGSHFVIGSRMKNPKGMPAIRKMSNKVTSGIISILTRQNVEDSQSGFRGIQTNVLKNITLNTSRYDLESEMIFKIAGKGYNITNVPISTIYGDETSTINPITDGLRFWKVVMGNLFN